MSSFSIRSSTIRLGIFISTLVIAIIIFFQLAWLRKVYRYEEKEFDHSIVKVIRGLYEDLDVTAYSTTPLSELIEKPRAHLYLARISLPVNTDTLSSYLQYELEDFDIFTRCQFALYQAAGKQYVFSFNPGSATPKNAGSFPVFNRPYDYIALYFPNRRQYILSQMNFWIITSAVLLFILLLFGGSLFYFYRQKFLQEAQRDLIHNFAHEFKTPVSVISLAADVLKDESILAKPAKLATYAGIVQYQANYLNQQVEKLLEFAYAESRKLQLQKEAVDMHQLIRTAVDNLAPGITKKNASLIFKLDAPQHIIQADKDYLLIVITNLLDNAVKYAREPQIIISTAVTHTKFLLLVKDNGIGIERSEFKKIFKKFYRVQQGETYVAKGFGLGLPFIKKIMAAHGGKIKVDSWPGTGSVFQIELPLN